MKEDWAGKEILVMAYLETPLETVSQKTKIIQEAVIIMVNGHWNKFFHKLNASPGSGGEDYWRYFLGDPSSFLESAQTYFNDPKSKFRKEIYVDGSSLFGGDQSGKDRKKAGLKYAKKNYDALTNNGKTTRFYFISHSEGSAYSAGIASFLSSQGDKVCESIMLSADEGDEFSVEGNYTCYQIVAGFLLDEKKKPSNYRFDPVVGDNRVAGVTRYGAYISNSSIMNVHTTTVSKSIFAIITQLKSVRLVQHFTSTGEIVYRAEPDPGLVWCKIDGTFVDNERIALILRSVL